MKSGIYVITNTVNGECYVGSAVNIEKRWKDHSRMLMQENHHSIKLQRAWGKYGESSFSFKVLLYCERQNLIFYEQRAIEAFSAFGIGYNMSPTAGSSLGRKASEETRAKQRALRLGCKLTEEHKRKIGLAGLGNRYNAGRKLTEEHKQKLRGRRHTEEAKAKIGAASKGNQHALGQKQSAEVIAKRMEKIRGVPKSPEHVAKVAAAQKGRTFTAEHCAKLSAAKLGKQQPKAVAAMAKANTGRKLSPETLAKRHAARCANRDRKSVV